LIVNILFLLVVFFANIIQGITGFAGTVLAMPASIFLIGIDSAKVVLNVMGIFASLWLVVLAYKHINWKEIVKVVVLMLIGMVAGMYLYSILPLSFLLKVYAVFIILIAIKGILVKEEKNIKEWILILIVLAAGIIHGMFVSGGPLLMIYILKKSENKSVFRANIATVWIILNSYIAFAHYKQGLYTSENIQILGLSIIPLVIGTIIGNILHHKISQKNFLYLSYVLLFISGVALVFK
jgi:uncharacterized membrane protein YfcA